MFPQLPPISGYPVYRALKFSRVRTGSGAQYPRAAGGTVCACCSKLYNHPQVAGARCMELSKNTTPHDTDPPMQTVGMFLHVPQSTPSWCARQIPDPYDRLMLYSRLRFRAFEFSDHVFFCGILCPFCASSPRREAGVGMSDTTDSPSPIMHQGAARPMPSNVRPSRG